MITPPETRYTRAGGGYVAYQTWGEGSVDLVTAGGGWTIDSLWEHPHVVGTLERLGGFARNIWFDVRGSGASSSFTDTQTGTGLDAWIDDLNAVMTAAGSERVAVLGISEGAVPAVLYAATYPERVSSLVIVNGVVRFLRAPDYPLGLPVEHLDRYLEAFEANWATEASAALLAPSMVDNPAWVRWLRRAQRLTFAPDDAAAGWRTLAATDVHHVMPSVQAPTLILHRRDDQHARVEHSRHIAERIPGAAYLELDGADHVFFAGDTGQLLDEIEEFITGARPVVATNRVLATVLFTDIVGSSERAVVLGDDQWRSTLDAHDAVVRSQLARFSGREVNTTGDGFVATFDAPARAIRCALELVEAVRPLGIEIRTGVHTGEIELRGEDIGGVSVNTAARVQSLARPSEVLVSRTVTDLVAGSGIAFADRGEHELRGIPGRWALFAAMP